MIHRISTVAEFLNHSVPLHCLHCHRHLRPTSGRNNPPRRTHWSPWVDHKRTVSGDDACRGDCYDDVPSGYSDRRTHLYAPIAWSFADRQYSSVASRSGCPGLDCLYHSGRDLWLSLVFRCRSTDDSIMKIKYENFCK